MYNCKFCNRECPIEDNEDEYGRHTRTIAFCPKCNVDFVFDKTNLITLIYRIFNIKYTLVIMDESRNQTEIYFDPSVKSISPLIVKDVYLNTKPKDIIPLLDRILNLTAFL
jgi:hypothetical protein